MAATAITLSSSTLYYGTDAEINAKSANIGDVGYATDTNREYTNIDGGTTWLKTRAESDVGLVKNAATVTGSATTYNSNEILGFIVEDNGGGTLTWSATFKGGGTVTFIPVNCKDYRWHLTSLTTAADAGCKVNVFI